MDPDRLIALEGLLVVAALFGLIGREFLVLRREKRERERARRRSRGAE